jgi:hypothetical protein
MVEVESGGRMMRRKKIRAARTGQGQGRGFKGATEEGGDEDWRENRLVGRERDWDDDDEGNRTNGLSQASEERVLRTAMAWGFSVAVWLCWGFCRSQRFTGGREDAL